MTPAVSPTCVARPNWRACTGSHSAHPEPIATPEVATLLHGGARKLKGIVESCVWALEDRRWRAAGRRAGAGNVLRASAAAEKKSGQRHNCVVWGSTTRAAAGATGPHGAAACTGNVTWAAAGVDTQATGSHQDGQKNALGRNDGRALQTRQGPLHRGLSRARSWGPRAVEAGSRLRSLRRTRRRRRGAARRLSACQGTRRRGSAMWRGPAPDRARSLGVVPGVRRLAVNHQVDQQRLALKAGQVLPGVLHRRDDGGARALGGLAGALQHHLVVNL